MPYTLWMSAACASHSGCPQRRTMRDVSDEVIEQRPPPAVAQFARALRFEEGDERCVTVVTRHRDAS